MELTEDPSASAAAARQLLLNRRKAINRVQNGLEMIANLRARKRLNRKKRRLIAAVMATANKPGPSREQSGRAANLAVKKARHARIAARREKRASELAASAAFKRGEFKPTIE